MASLLEFAVRHDALPPVLPGYPLVTVGGAAAMNIHGKNQAEVGNFGDHVNELTVFHPRIGEIRCSPDVNSEIFWLTIGGFGLTGHITSLDLSLKPLLGRSARVTRLAVSSLRQTVEVMEGVSSEEASTYSWHNLNLSGSKFGSGTVYAETLCDTPPPRAAGTWSPAVGKRWPFSAHNRFSVPLMCLGYQTMERLASRTRTTDLYRAFFPFVGKEIYFGLYGKRGFREYQVLFPRASWDHACKELAEAIRRTGAHITLASLKIFRGQRRLLNFSGTGVCLALDAPNTPATLQLFARLDSITVDLGGHANLSKDGRVSAGTIKAMYGRHYDEFCNALSRYDSSRHFDSELRKRLNV